MIVMCIRYDVKLTCQQKDKKLHEGKSICSRQTVREDAYREANVEACIVYQSYFF